MKHPEVSYSLNKDEDAKRRNRLGDRGLHREPPSHLCLLFHYPKQCTAVQHLATVRKPG